jgi:hypothetical protein
MGIAFEKPDRCRVHPGRYTGWSSYSGTVNDNGTNKSVTISPPTGNLFFRLEHQWADRSESGTVNLKIICGGQTGADRAALDWAIEYGTPHGGWCPKGRKAEDGPIDLRYTMQETPSSNYEQRTEWNVSDSHGTVVLSIAARLTGGSKKTVEMAHKHHKPVLHLSREAGPSMPQQKLLCFLRKHRIKILNVAGPRASKEPEVAGFVKQVLDRTWPTT